MMPTKEAMLAKMRWLTEGASAGDEFFFHYSGHGGQTEDKLGDEADGKDETLMPSDCREVGIITDDDLYSILCSNLPKGAKMWVVLDCCHSGTALDLRFKVQLSKDGRSAKVKKKPKRRVAGGKAAPDPPKAEVIMLSGCKDDQTSADIGAGALSEKAAGAMTTALRNTLTPEISCHKMLQVMRKFLKRNKFQQVPQMSSEQFVQLDSSYVQYKAKRKAACRDLDLSSMTAPAPSAQTNGGGGMNGSFDGGALSRLDALEEEIAMLRKSQGQAGSTGGVGSGYGAAPSSMSSNYSAVAMTPSSGSKPPPRFPAF